MLLFGRRTDQPPEHFHPIASKSRGERAWKFAVCDVSYLALYLIAGTIIFPYVKSFYATQTVPSMPTIFALQLLSERRSSYCYACSWCECSACSGSAARSPWDCYSLC